MNRHKESHAGGSTARRHHYDDDVTHGSHARGSHVGFAYGQMVGAALSGVCCQHVQREVTHLDKCREVTSLQHRCREGTSLQSGFIEFPSVGTCSMKSFLQKGQAPSCHDSEQALTPKAQDICHSMSLAVSVFALPV